MAAYRCIPCKDAFAQNHTAPKEHDRRLPRGNTPTWRTRTPPSLTHPFTKTLLLNNAAYNQNPVAAYPAKGTFLKESHPRRISWPSTGHRQHSKDPLVNFALNTGSKNSQKGNIGPESASQVGPTGKKGINSTLFHALITH